MDKKTIDAICDLAAKSDVARRSWPGRGVAPIGYIKGMAVTYALCLQKLAARDSAALAMVRVVDDGQDVFDHLMGKLKIVGIDTDGAPPIDRLRALFTIMMGLGMRESSGRYCEGRDRSASNTTAETAEAGLFQQSWDSRKASPEIPKLLNFYHSSDDDDFLAIFKEGVKPRDGDFDVYGTGDGATFQGLCRECPAFAVQVAAIGLRTLSTHWGPIIRREVEIAPQAVQMLRDVEKLVGATQPATSSSQQGGWFAAAIGALMALFRRGPSVSPPVPVPAHPASVEPAWMRWANKEVGFHETGTNRNIGRYTVPAKCGSEGDPWCAIFVNAALESCGVRGTRSAMARSFERDPNFVRLSGPAFGAIVTMWRGSQESGLGHVFFYVGHINNGKLNQTHVLGLGGNQSDQVCRQPEPVNRITGYWWPKGQPLPTLRKIVVNAGGKEGSET
jgi:uncharacterized protein (TIGR02594 family)